MPFQIHAVMQQPQNVDHLVIVSAGDSEHDEMSPLAPVPRNMKRPDGATDFRPLLDTGDWRAGSPGLQRR